MPTNAALPEGKWLCPECAIRDLSQMVSLGIICHYETASHSSMNILDHNYRLLSGLLGDLSYRG